MADDDSFFSRWSRRKQQVRTGQPLPADPPAPAPAVAPTPAARPAPVAAPAAAAPVAPAPAPAEDRPPPPTLDDVADLTPQSDFSRFVARDVSPDVRNAAVKKLFADPHFNVMDGLDIYIDDYTQPSPLSKADMARMVGAQFLKLVDDPAEKKAAAEPVASEEPAAATNNPPDSGTTAAPTGEPTVAELPPPHDDHADLQLQPDHAPERERSGPGAG
ncbi:DUF3306 domain-containing protein [Hydrogenophaga sp. IBVHS2]|uniref:DUF3306 domain-containing protein n=1 Tax=Hydrogenophaga sp. IBVHS2 TaxID=1985170 RepID=UPI000A2D266E|nr:DUF3306 domain-containing protein [Hydrogenophaga sp. IBVHS2]OSZ62966.1 hypothetical protein CAP38_14510 [Hydrogenophaga sp. IBVHS2]